MSFVTMASSVTQIKTHLRNHHRPTGCQSSRLHAVTGKQIYWKGYALVFPTISIFTQLWMSHGIFKIVFFRLDKDVILVFLSVYLSTMFGCIKYLIEQLVQVLEYDWTRGLMLPEEHWDCFVSLSHSNC